MSNISINLRENEDALESSIGSDAFIPELNEIMTKMGYIAAQLSQKAENTADAELSQDIRKYTTALSRIFYCISEHWKKLGSPITPRQKAFQEAAITDYANSLIMENSH